MPATIFSLCTNHPNRLVCNGIRHQLMPQQLQGQRRPVAFTFQERRRVVAEIIDRWYEGGIEAGQPEVDYFKVRTTEGGIFLLRYLSLSDSWSIQVYKDPAAIIGVC
jgi:hypothetical protein